MTWATPTPTSPSAGDPATKFGIAIGSGATLPSVTCNFVCAPASEGSSKLAAAPAPPIRMSRRLNGNEGSENDVTGIAGSFLKNINCETSAWGQNRCPCTSTVRRSRRAVLQGQPYTMLREPLLRRDISLRGKQRFAQHGVWLTLQDCANRCFRRGLISRRASARDHLRGCCEATIRVQPDPDRDVQFLRVFDTRLYIPQARQPRP